MGTETHCYIGNDNHTSTHQVKLNNPLMGTETTHWHIFEFVPIRPKS